MFRRNSMKRLKKRSPLLLYAGGQWNLYDYAFGRLDMNKACEEGFLENKAAGTREENEFVKRSREGNVKEFTQLSAFVNIGGFAEIGSMVYIGLSTCVKDRAKVGNNTIVSMASAVIRDLPEEVIAVGNPARPMKKNENHRVF